MRELANPYRKLLAETAIPMKLLPETMRLAISTTTFICDWLNIAKPSQTRAVDSLGCHSDWTNKRRRSSDPCWYLSAVGLKPFGRESPDLNLVWL